MVDIKNIKKKVCLLGDASVGKTSLIRRYVFDEFDDKYITTLGAKVSKKEFEFTFPVNNENSINVNITLTIWDIIGQKDESAQRIQPMYFSGANGALVICDITRKSTFESIPEWVKSFFKVVNMVPIVILGNKIDLYGNAEVYYDDLIDYAQTLQFPVYLTSAKINSGVEQAFEKLAKQMLENTFSSDRKN
jgi:small GTP-binding protein